VDLLLVFGDQDSYHAAEHDVVSSPIWVSEILHAEGLPGLFVVQARRAEILAEQGRHDVIRALRRHEIGLHGRDQHPVVPEIIEGLSWEDGVAALLASERAELETLGGVFDVAPVCSSEHRGLGAPQIFGAAHQLGLPYLFGFPAAPPRHSVSWFAGALNVPFDAPVPDFLGFFPAVFDDALHDDRAFEALFARLRAHIDRALAVDLPLLVVFVCHPERLCYTGPLEMWQYGNGRNHGPAAVPAGVEMRRSRSEIDRALANLRRLLRDLRDMPGLRPVTVAEVVQRYGHQPATVSQDELTTLAEAALAERQIPIGRTVSPAETMLAWAEAAIAAADGSPLPAALPCRPSLGPLETPPLAPELPALSGATLVELARRLLAASAASGHLPAALPHDGRWIGLGTLYGALATAYYRAAQGLAVTDNDVRLDLWPRYPAQAAGLAERQRRCADDPLVQPGLSTEAAAVHMQRQTWTLKPALPA
jgi:hypothetical protein